MAKHESDQDRQICSDDCVGVALYRQRRFCGCCEQLLLYCEETEKARWRKLQLRM